MKKLITLILLSIVFSNIGFGQLLPLPSHCRVSPCLNLNKKENTAVNVGIIILLSTFAANEVIIRTVDYPKTSVTFGIYLSGVATSYITYKIITRKKKHKLRRLFK